MSSPSTTSDLAKNIYNAIVKPPAWTSGTCKISPEDARIFYNINAEHRASWLDLSSASTDELQNLTSVCEAATFGRNHEDVLDETYRKAWKLEIDQFSTSLNPYTYGIIDEIKSHILSHKGGFFKAHKDTPRGEDMIGSLVAVLATPHEGGGLLLRHDRTEWEFDSRTLLAGQDRSSIAWVAFFSDVEHEVKEVTSGFRVTLTWNLYLGPHPSSPSSIDPSPAQRNLVSLLTNTFNNPDFIPEGGYVGFGLDYQYPVRCDRGTSLKSIHRRLKGSDAMLMHSLELAGYKAGLRTLYRDLFEEDHYRNNRRYSDDEDTMETSDSEEPEWASRSYVMATEVVDIQTQYDEDILEFFLNNGAIAVYPYGKKPPRDLHGQHRQSARRILWITPPKSASRFPTAFVGLGNTADVGYIYADVVIVCKIPSAKHRISTE